jgi:LDH2 family malate/lactate/ureidoglycolate dehydrogenase
MIGIAMCNAKPSIAPWGGRKPILGTNPISIAIPTEKEDPIVLDMAVSVVALSKIIIAKEKGEKIPEGWAINERGRVTTDPAEAIKGGLLPFGGYKGYGIALIIDILAGAMTGAASGSKVISLYDEEKVATLGQLFIAIDINWSGVEDFKKRVDSVIRAIKDSPPAEGVKEIFIPGEIEFREERRRLKEGIPIDVETWESLEKLKKKIRWRHRSPGEARQNSLK